MSDLPETGDDDYYTDPDGKLVFTAACLKRRGYCCENGCRHCPYGFRKTHGAETAPDRSRD